jgi:hypothetical protein
MGRLSIDAMRRYLGRSIASLNENKLRGLLAEIDFRRRLGELGFADRVSVGGWIARRVGAGEFAHQTAAFFPEMLAADIDYAAGRVLPDPPHGLHTICSTFHQTGISAYFLAGSVAVDNDADSLSWHAVQLGLPTEQHYQPFPKCVEGQFALRPGRYNFLRYHADTSRIPDTAIPEEFAKEHLRVTFQNHFMSEISDVDGIFWGEQYTYPLEIKEKTPARSKKLGPFFGLDVGPFVKLAHYVARRGNLHSLFVVREIANLETRELVNWWFITFEQLARFASWFPMAGGTSMGGGRSAVVCIPKVEFRELNTANLAML